MSDGPGLTTDAGALVPGIQRRTGDRLREALSGRDPDYVGHFLFTPRPCSHIHRRIATHLPPPIALPLPHSLVM
jgi:hypothetical protein